MSRRSFSALENKKGNSDNIKVWNLEKVEGDEESTREKRHGLGA